MEPVNLRKEIQEGIPKRVKHLRGNLSQEKFAEKVGISQPTISRIENGISSSCVEHIAQIALTTGCTTDWLILGISQPESINPLALTREKAIA